VQTRVPPLIEETLALAGTDKNAVDCFLCHQPNRFMLEKLADKLGVPREKLPCNVVETCGNASSATIPTAICLNLAERLRRERLQVCLAGFGVGLTWGALVMDLGPLAACELIDYPEGEAERAGIL